MSLVLLLKSIITLSISGSLLFGIWLIGRKCFKKFFTRRFQYYVLFIVVLRFSLPITPIPSIAGVIYHSLENSSLASMLSHFISRTQNNNLVVVGEGAIQVGNNVILGNNRGLPFENYIAITWLIIAILLVGRRITKYQSFARYIKASWKPIDQPEILDILSTALEQRNIKHSIDVYTSSLISSPLLLGIKKCVIVLPSEQLSNEQLYSIFSHELAHYQNKDMFYKWLVQITVCLHWFNPVIYSIEKLVNSECEFACDETVIRKLDTKKIHRYGLTLIEMAANGLNTTSQSTTLNLYTGTTELKDRLHAIKQYQPTTTLSRTVSNVFLLTFLLITYILGGYYLY